MFTTLKSKYFITAVIFSLISFLSIWTVYGLGWAVGTFIVTVVIFLAIWYLWGDLRRVKRKDRPKPKNRFKFFYICIVVIFSLMLLILYLTPDFGIGKWDVTFRTIWLIYGSVLVATLTALLLDRKYSFFSLKLRGKLLRGKLPNTMEEHLRKALKNMDSTAKWYNSEEEANRELVSCLKSQGINAIYQYKLPNGRTVDAKVRNVLIEGKLSPDTAEVDRLFGQLSDYIGYSNEINILIYGKLDKDARKRIENEIRSRYYNKVFLICLNNPRRQRSLFGESV